MLKRARAMILRSDLKTKNCYSSRPTARLLKADLEGWSLAAKGDTDGPRIVEVR